MTITVENTVSKAAERKSHYYSLLYTEMTERRRAEENLRVFNALLATLSEAQLRFVAGTELSTIFRDLLTSLLEITQSEFGLLGEFERTEEGELCQAGLVTTHDNDQDYDRRAYFVHLLQRVAEAGKPIIVGGSRMTLAQDNPSGLSQTAQSFLGIPFVIDESTMGVIGLAGGAQGYNQETFGLLKSVRSTCVQLIIASREQQQRAAAEAALVNERALLAERVDERTKELRLANAELARAARAKDEFLATMNHELRTPLTAMLLFSESLDEQRQGSLNERQRRAVRGIDESARHLLTLINDILDVAKIDAGMLTFETAPCGVENVCRSSLRLVVELAHKKSLRVETTIDPTLGLLVADERRLKQMLVNLLGNAVKFTPAHGSIGLQVSGDLDRNVIHFTVWDTGIGISPEDMPKLFKPFVQIDSGHSRHFGGTGLGLVLVYRMAELHGGSVSVESELGAGSRFTISLPWTRVTPVVHHETASRPDLEEMEIDRNHPASMAPAQSGSTTGHMLGKRDQSAGAPAPLILISEDNELILGALTNYLQDHHYRVIVARNGVEAIQETRSHLPDLILMDVQMPEMDGFQTTRQIRADTLIQDIPIIALTALVMPGDRERCLAAGFSDYVSKPLQLRQLEEVISTLLNQRSAQTELGPIGETAG